MKKILSTIQTAAMALALSGGMLHAVTFGQPDGNRHPYVGTLLFQAADGNFYSCTGTLLSSTVMLTAAHCTIDGGVVNQATWVTFAPAISFANRGNYGSIAEFLNDPANGWVRADVYPHPNYRGTYPNTYDIGVAVLRTPVSMPVYGALPPLGFLETVKGKANQFTVVGYGMQGYIKPFASDNYVRHMGSVRLIELKSTLNGAEMSAKFTNNPGRGGGSCYGDSGGPVFYGTSNIVTAVVSWGRTPCIGVDYQFRTDTAVAQDFLAGFLD